MLCSWRSGRRSDQTGTDECGGEAHSLSVRHAWKPRSQSSSTRKPTWDSAGPTDDSTSNSSRLVLAAAHLNSSLRPSYAHMRAAMWQDPATACVAFLGNPDHAVMRSLRRCETPKSVPGACVKNSFLLDRYCSYLFAAKCFQSVLGHSIPYFPFLIVFTLLELFSKERCERVFAWGHATVPWQFGRVRGGAVQSLTQSVPKSSFTRLLAEQQFWSINTDNKTSTVDSMRRSF